MPVKKGAAWKQDRTTGRKYAGEDGDKELEPSERQQFWVSSYTRRRQAGRGLLQAEPGL